MAIVQVIAGTIGTYGATAPSVTAMNGTYSIYSTWNSASQYSNGAAYIGFNGSSWVWSSAVNGGGTDYATNSSSSTTVPTSGWSGSGNPTLAAITTGLATSYTASGAGTSAANGTYLPVSGANAIYSGDNATQYCNGTDFLGSYELEWYIYASVSDSYPYLYSNESYGESPTSFPLTGWATVGGTSPAPTFSISPPALKGNFFYMF